MRGAPRSPAPRTPAHFASEAGHQLGDDLLHDLAGAAADGQQPRVPERPRHRRLHHVAHAAVELLAVVDDFLDQVAGEELRHADLLHRRFLAVVEVAGAVRQPARRLDGGEVLDEPVAPDLELGQRLAERAALGKPLAKFQVWRHRFVEHLTAIEAARWLTYRACDLYNRKEAAVKEISMAKLFAGDLIQKVVYGCQQFHGGMGYVVESPVARAFRDARLLTIGGGTSEIMKEIIAKLVPGF